MIKLGLIGRNIAHSKSQEIYEKILGTPIDYTLLDFETPQDIPPLSELFKNLDGLSVTAPYKKTLYDDSFAESLIKPFGSTNCIRMNNKLIQMTNTDYFATQELLPILIRKHSVKKCLVLGNGSMSSIVLAVLKQLKISTEHLYRTQNGDLNSLDYHKYAQGTPGQVLLINCCAREFVFAQTQKAIPKQIIFWDLNYSMKEHEYLRQVCHYYDGLELLDKQARHALRYWSLA